jgi:hypothetical protein
MGASTMADYHPLIARADAARHALYDRARGALVMQLRSQTPTLSESDINRERGALDDAIRKVEFEISGPYQSSEPRPARTVTMSKTANPQSTAPLGISHGPTIFQASLPQCSLLYSRNCPKILGPKYPPRVPMELMAAMPAAAPASLSYAVGSFQNTGTTEKKPQLAMQITAILAIGLAAIEANPSPTAMATKDITTCHIRSQFLSECHPQYVMPIAAMT